MNVVFEGGGVKGLAYIGALRYLETRGLRIANCAGTSVGAIIACLVIAGYDSYELENIINSLDVNKLWPKQKKNTIKNTIYVIKNRHVYSIKPLEETLRYLLKRRGICTFKDLRVGNNYRLKIIVTSKETKKMVILPEGIKEFGINPDNLDVASAACMSASLPFIYPSYKIKTHSFVDGGLTENFPLWIFNENVYGFRLNNNNKGITKTVKKMFVKTRTKGDQENIIYIDTSGYKATDFLKGMQERYILYNRGFYYTKMYFDKIFLKNKIL